MKTLSLSFLIFFAALFTAAANEAATRAAQAHLKNFLSGNAEELTETYAEEVRLMPGHEFLQPKYGLAEDSDGSESVQVESDQLIGALRDLLEDQPSPLDSDELNAIFDILTFEPLNPTSGDFATEPTDPVSTPDGMLHFTVVEGDEILKIYPPEEDFILLQLREIDGSWKVVAEYLD